MPDLGLRIFWDENSAREFIERTRWPDGPTCTRCRSAKVIRMGGRTQPGMFFCRDCRNKFTCRIGTFLEHSHVPLRTWLQAALLAANGDRRLSPQRLMRRLDLGSYRTAWWMAQRIREALYRRAVEKRARPAMMNVAPDGAAPDGACEVTFDDAVQALIACPQSYGTASDGQRDRNGCLGQNLLIRQSTLGRDDSISTSAAQTPGDRGRRQDWRGPGPPIVEPPIDHSSTRYASKP